jgi:hypothetical protein
LKGEGGGWDEHTHVPPRQIYLAVSAGFWGAVVYMMYTAE